MELIASVRPIAKLKGKKPRNCLKKQEERGLSHMDVGLTTKTVRVRRKCLN